MKYLKASVSFAGCKHRQEMMFDISTVTNYYLNSPKVTTSIRLICRYLGQLREAASISHLRDGEKKKCVSVHGKQEHRKMNKQRQARVSHL